MENKTDNELIEDFYVSQGGKPAIKSDIEFYSSSWDMIMPVVGKIRDTLQDNSLYDKAKHLWEIICISLSTAELKCVNLAVVQFIKWYNDHGK